LNGKRQEPTLYALTIGQVLTGRHLRSNADLTITPSGQLKVFLRDNLRQDRVDCFTDLSTKPTCSDQDTLVSSAIVVRCLPPYLDQPIFLSK
jgi:hypothetical protein